jgi:hypothetical protein
MVRSWYRFSYIWIFTGPEVVVLPQVDHVGVGGMRAVVRGA